ncbi:hypothetical protein B0H14DRAFT_2590863 [Mycena olivaceomarginata]|nr:hypothetical protein B0H14DRAFT_2590863 [Mycena olivaceomarginata]
MAPQIRLAVAEQEEKNSAGRIWPGCIFHLGDLQDIPFCACSLAGCTYASPQRPSEGRPSSGLPGIVHQGSMPVVRLSLRCKQLTSHSPRVCDEKLHPIPMSLAPGEDEKIWVLGRGPHAAIECTKRFPAKVTQEERIDPAQSDVD